MSCRYEDWDGSYVLGALGPSERSEYEQHLAFCHACSGAVGELAGLPGLLSRVDASVLEADSSDEPPPPTLLPTLLGSVRRDRRRRTLGVSGLAAAAAVLAATALFGWVGHDPQPGQAVGSTGPTTTSTATAPALPMVAVGDAPLRANLSLQAVAWGTRMDLTCRYQGDRADYHGGSSATYLLVVHTRDGGSQQVGTWKAPQGATMRLAAATSASPAQISSVEVQSTDGRAVLRLTL